MVNQFVEELNLVAQNPDLENTVGDPAQSEPDIEGQHRMTAHQMAQAHHKRTRPMSQQF